MLSFITHMLLLIIHILPSFSEILRSGCSQFKSQLFPPICHGSYTIGGCKNCANYIGKLQVLYLKVWALRMYVCNFGRLSHDEIIDFNNAMLHFVLFHNVMCYIILYIMHPY